MKIILAGGGTGGHIYPAVTIAREFLRRDAATEILFVGGKRGLESEIIPKEGFKLVTLNLQGIPRKVSLKVIQSLWLAGRGINDTFKILKDFKPDLVIGTGGYVCGPMVLAAALKGVPTAIQEQNAFPGWTNRALGKVVKRVFLAYLEAGRYFNPKRVYHSGNPIRTEEFKNMQRPLAEKSLGIRPGHINLLVFGGSQSARRINQTLMTVLKELLSRFGNLQIIMMTGLKEYDAFQNTVNEMMSSGALTEGQSNRLYLKPYFYKIGEAYSVTDLVIARAGAISLAEITYFGLPALLVPYPFATNNHQEFNARVLEKGGAAKIIPEKDLTPETLLNKLSEILNDPGLRQSMAVACKKLSRPRATEDIVSELIKLAGH